MLESQYLSCATPPELQTNHDPNLASAHATFLLSVLISDSSRSWLNAVSLYGFWLCAFEGIMENPVNLQSPCAAARVMAVGLKTMDAAFAAMLERVGK